MLTNLRKLCNHPVLYRSRDGEDAAAGGDDDAAEDAFDPDQSGKCRVAGRLGVSRGAATSTGGQTCGS